MAHRGPIDTGHLWTHVDRLTLDRKQRLVRQAHGQKPTTQWVPIPSLWTQLEEAIGSTTTSDGGRSKSTGSAAPLDLTIAVLMQEMTRDVVRALRELGAPARIQASEHGLTVDTRAGLRHLPAVLLGTHDQQLVDDWVDRYRSWVTRSETALTLDGDGIDTRGIRGHACPACDADHVLRDDDGETYRDPALVVAFRDGQVLHATCRACSTGWWRGDDLDQLAVALHGRMTA